MIRRVATATAVGLSGAAALLAAEVVIAGLRTYAKPDLRLAVRGGTGRPGRRVLRLVLLGDAVALGVGVDRVEDTIGGQLAELLAERHPARRVELLTVAVARSRSVDLSTQVARALVGRRPDIAVIIVGANDITHLDRPSEAAAHLGLAVRRLRRAGIAVVAGACMDLGAMRAFPPPLRQILGWYGRSLAHRQLTAVRAAGGVALDLGAETGTVFRADPGTLCYDGFHPSSDGYRVLAHTLLPAVEDAARDHLVR